MVADALHFQVRSSSSDEIYKIEATFSPNLKITCTCQGGLMGQMCKHRTALLMEDASAVIAVNMDDLRSLSSKAKATPLGDAMREMVDLESEATKIKKTIAAQKKKIARLLNGGSSTNAAYASRY